MLELRHHIATSSPSPSPPCHPPLPPTTSSPSPLCRHPPPPSAVVSSQCLAPDKAETDQLLQQINSPQSDHIGRPPLPPPSPPTTTASTSTQCSTKVETAHLLQQINALESDISRLLAAKRTSAEQRLHLVNENQRLRTRNQQLTRHLVTATADNCTKRTYHVTDTWPPPGERLVRGVAERLPPV